MTSEQRLFGLLRDDWNAIVSVAVLYLSLLGGIYGLNLNRRLSKPYDQQRIQDKIDEALRWHDEIFGKTKTKAPRRD